MTIKTDYNCPTWCERTDHEADELTQGEAAIHFGPDFGDVSLEGIDGSLEALVYERGNSIRVEGAAALRKLAAELLQAAEWIEAHS